MKKLIVFLSIVFLFGCSTQQKIKQVQRKTMRDFKKGRIKFEYPKDNFSDTNNIHIYDILTN